MCRRSDSVSTVKSSLNGVHSGGMMPANFVTVMSAHSGGISGGCQR